MLLDVLKQLSTDTGLDIVQKRPLLLTYLNRAAKEMHKELECNKIYREATLVVSPNKVVSLPSFIGELRGMRMHTGDIPFEVKALSPKYKNDTSEYKYKNWRDLGESATHTIPSQGKLIFTVSDIETTPVTVRIKGQSNDANSIEEDIEISSTLVQSSNLFGPRIDSIFCSSARTKDITVYDYLNIEIAILYNNFPTTRYKTVDVSEVFWNLDTEDGESLIDVLYKVSAFELNKDSDSFYAGDDYDEAWYNMAMFFFLKPLQNRLNDAVAHRAVGMDTITAAKRSGEQGAVKKLSFGRNKFYGLFNRSSYLSTSDQ